MFLIVTVNMKRLASLEQEHHAWLVILRSGLKSIKIL